LRQFAGWCQQHQLGLFQARRADIEFFGRDLEARGPARATINRRLCTVAGFGPPAEHALISVLALNGLRVSEAANADIEALGIERGHRTLVITRKGGKVVTIPLAPRTARAIDLAIGERVEGPIFLAADGRRLDRHSAGRIVRPDHPQSRDHEASRAAHTQARIYHRGPGCRCPAARRAGSRLSRCPADDHEI
jgi:site-specific recombinase XerD